MGRHEKGQGSFERIGCKMSEFLSVADDDLVVLVDENDHPIGTASKLEIHHSQTPLHRAFSIFLFNQDGKFLMQQRALTKKTWPGVWSNSCCGHVRPGETTESAAHRRLEYELGLTKVDLTLALPKFRYRAEKDGIVENEICPVFIGATAEEPDPNPDEVESLQWIDWNEFIASLNDPGSGISPWAVEETQELIKSDIFRQFHFGEA